MAVVVVVAVPVQYGNTQLTSRSYAAHETYNPVQLYSYGYRIKDEYDTIQFRKEETEGSDVIKGSYGYTDVAGLYRKVEYIADARGFRALIKTNEPGTTNQNSADVEIISEQGPQLHQTLTEEYSARNEIERPIYSHKPEPNYYQPAYNSVAKRVSIQSSASNAPRYASVYSAPALSSTSTDKKEDRLEKLEE
ncbi:cuticle protein-like [Limulus polyphemus]|uniref:Cuticle protein-like n=1 Tax=Limulus polyphemus TaxID=6850 RepID=A0ABM1BRG6_LIMPO|nr:cuticle protein-like [Limulus polyphemus]